MTKRHAHVVDTAKHMNMVGALGSPPPESGAELTTAWWNE